MSSRFSWFSLNGICRFGAAANCRTRLRRSVVALTNDWSELGVGWSAGSTRVIDRYAKAGHSFRSAVCDSKLGSYSCTCPPGEALQYALIRGSIIASCIRPTTRTKRSAGRVAIIVLASVASAVALVLLLLGAVILNKKLKARKAKKLKEKNFKKNRGMLLQQLVDKDIAERMLFSLEELEKATNSFDEARRIGGGGHGTVYKGILSNQQVVAIKKSKVIVQSEIDDFINEVAILSTINHRNIVRLLGCCLETEVPLLVYEFISNGTLSQHLHAEGPQSLSWVHRLKIAAAVANAIAYLHSSASTAIIHRDIKTDNILLDDRLIPKISDFGTSRGIPIDNTGIATAVQGTIGYVDPEYCQTSRLTEKSDVYSFGAVLVELLTRRKPSVFLPSRQIGLISHFNSLVSLGKICEILDPQIILEAGKDVETVAALAASCLVARGDERPTMRQLDIKLQEMLPTRSTTRQVEAQDDFDDEVDDEGDDEQDELAENEDQQNHCNDNVDLESTNREAGSRSSGQRTLSLWGAEAALALSLREAEAALAKQVAVMKVRSILQDKEVLQVQASGLLTLDERKADTNHGVQVLADSEEVWHSFEDTDDYSGDSGDSDVLPQDHRMKSVEFEGAAFCMETLTTVQKMEFRSDNDDYKLSKSRKLSLKKKCIGSEVNTERMSRGDVNMQLLNLAEQEKHLKKQRKHSLQGREEEKFKASFLSNKPANPETKSEDGEGYKGWHTNRLTFAPESSKDGMTRKDDPNDYVVIDPLLEKGKQKFNKIQAKLKKERS